MATGVLIGFFAVIGVWLGCLFLFVYGVWAAYRGFPPSRGPTIRCPLCAGESTKDRPLIYFAAIEDSGPKTAFYHEDCYGLMEEARRHRC